VDEPDLCHVHRPRAPRGHSCERAGSERGGSRHGPRGPADAAGSAGGSLSGVQFDRSAQRETCAALPAVGSVASSSSSSSVCVCACVCLCLCVHVSEGVCVCVCVCVRVCE